MTIAQLLAKGGLTMLPIYLCSLLAVAVFLRKLAQFYTMRLTQVDWFDAVLEHVKQGNLSAGVAACRDVQNPAAIAVRATVTALDEQPLKASAEGKRVGSMELQRLEESLSLLAFLAQVAPLLGLLGTVIGMVDMFIQLEQAGAANIAVSDLSSGIWKALLTTAAGLSVAVPSLAAHSFLSTRVDQFRLRLADLLEQLLYHAPVSVES